MPSDAKSIPCGEAAFYLENRSLKKTMKDGIVRIALANPKIKLINPKENAEICAELAKAAAAEGAALAVFPSLTLTGATAGDLYLHKPLMDAAEEALSAFVKKTEQLGLISLIGIPFVKDGRLYNCAAAVYGGEVLGLIPKKEADGVFSAAPAGTAIVDLFGASVPFGTDIVFAAEQYPDFSVTASVDGWDFDAPANICASLCAAPELVGSEDYAKTLTKALSYKKRCVALYAGAGEGESGTDYLYSARRLAYQGGKCLAACEDFSDGELLFAECDLQMSSHDRLCITGDASPAVTVFFDLTLPETEIRQPRPMSPFVPQSADLARRRCDKILEIQARGLAKRLLRSYSRRAVIGVSGGLDSTLALLVAARAMDILGRERKDIVAVTMPCFGTTSRTKSNAELLCEALGTDFRTVDIKDAVRGKLADIEHNPELVHFYFFPKMIFPVRLSM